MSVNAINRLIDSYNAAKLLGVTPRMVRYLAAEGRLSSIRRGRKLLYFQRHEVVEYSRAREVQRAR